MKYVLVVHLSWLCDQDLNLHDLIQGKIIQIKDEAIIVGII